MVDGRVVDEANPPEIVREKSSRLTGGRLACTLILERELTLEEMRRFYAVVSTDLPRPTDFFLEGRLVRYDCRSGGRGEVAPRRADLPREVVSNGRDRSPDDDGRAAPAGPSLDPALRSAGGGPRTVRH